jgi:glycosyltransferase
MPPHPTLYIRKDVVEETGFFDTSYRIAADYDYILRLFTREGLNSCYLPEVIVKMRLGGASNKSLSNIIRKSKEDIRALRKNRVGGLMTLIRKNLSKIPQFFHRKVI